MSLKNYNDKRDFKKTAEPTGKKEKAKGQLRFVVQKHDASSLHYDFRLEMEGVLKSWAVPKGPSLNPSDKRLAMMVEDHPFAYRNFEGVIPAGEYGGGTVIVWDEGTYEPSITAGKSRKEQEALLLSQLEAGKISFILHGQKLQGEYTIFRIKNRGENTWMLVKKKDDRSSTEDVTLEVNSVKTGKTLEEVALENGATLNHPAKKASAKKAAPTKHKTPPAKTVEPAAEPSAKKASAATQKLLGEYSSQATQQAMPQKLFPMLATLVDEPFDSKDWLFEIKWDGYRALAYCNGGKAELESRNLKSFTQKYIPVSNALAALKLEAVFDGEIVAVDDQGLANFQALQNWQNTPVRLQYFVFDILWLNGFNLGNIPLLQRKKILQQLIPANHDIIKYSEHVVGKGRDFFAVALKQGLEGIMAKKGNSLYLPDTRTPDWVKIKVSLRQEVVIAGYTEPRKTRKFFGSLLLGVYEGDQLVYIGHTGSGFNTKTLEQIYKKLQQLQIDESPFAKKPKTNMPATWVKPQLVCEIKFTEWTAERIARHAIFMGLREDKKAQNVTFEKSTSMAKLKNSKKGKATTEKAAKKVATKDQDKAVKNRKAATPPADAVQENNTVLTLDGHDVAITNLQKIYWPEDHFSKGDMVNYYSRMAPFILPYLLDRPHSLNRHPNGINAPNFFQKNMKGKVPAWIETFEEYSESTGVTVEYLVCSNEATLLYMVNLGCIEINPWHARKQDYLKPDWCLIDLDPDTGNTYEQVMEVALLVKKFLDAVGATSYVKTSGSTGIHIYIPLGARYTFEQSKQLSEVIVTLVNKELPDLTSMERTPAKRKGKIYLDFLQNKETQTAAAPYSLRPKPGVPVSTPLDWSELKKGLTPKTWNATNIFERVKREGDLFAPVLQKGIDLKGVLKKLQSLIS